MDHDDWEDFDDLFIKEGYGGYYDFVECLRQYASMWSCDVILDHEERQEFLGKVRDARTLRQTERLLSKLYMWHND